MNTRPLKSEVESRIAECKRAYTQACAAVLANRPNAHMHAQIACRQLEEARAELAAIAQLDELPHQSVQRNAEQDTCATY